MRYDRAVDTRNVLVFILLFVILLVVGTFFDLKIASFITFEGNMYSRVINAYGIYPMTLAFSSLGTLTISSRNYASRAKSLFQLIGGLFIVLVAMGLSFYYPYKYLPELDYRINLGIAIISNVLAGLYMYKQTLNAIKYEVKKYVTVLAWSVIVNSLLAYIIRFTLYRPTYLEVLQGVEYHAWCLTKLGFKTTTALPAIPVVSTISIAIFSLFGNVNPRFRNDSREILLFSQLLVVVVGVGCLISGEHYLSDIALSVIVSYAIELVVIKAVYGD